MRSKILNIISIFGLLLSLHAEESDFEEFLELEEFPLEEAYLDEDFYYGENSQNESDFIVEEPKDSSSSEQFVDSENPKVAEELEESIDAPTLYADNLNDKSVEEGFSYLTFYDVPVSPFYVDFNFGYQVFDTMPNFTYGYIFTTTGIVVPAYFYTKENELYQSPFVQGRIAVLLEDLLQLNFPLQVSISGKIVAPQSYFYTFTQAYQDPILPTLNGGFLEYDNFLANVQFARRYSYWEWKFTSNLPVLLDIHWYNTVPDFILEPFFDFCVSRMRQKYGVNYVQTQILFMEENLKNTYYDYGLGLRFSIPFLGGLSIFAEGAGYGSYAISSLHASQTYQVAANPGTFFKKEITKHTTNTKVKAKSGIIYSLNHFNFAITGEYEYWGYIGKVFNPVFTPSAMFFNPTSLKNGHLQTYSMSLDIGVNF